ncbi:DISARM system phospholipase D-like protein DrmC [Micromonospora sp. CPCC 206061]|uniref:DISARM system phospholipase D-like protein DrmC n=1 Tax=Micromonospora sp. CPCC 206061 TaxID=3122410 RepID=UPI002FEFFEF5
MSHDALALVLADVAADLPVSHIEAWAAALSTASRPTPAVEATLIDTRPGYAVATNAQRLVDAWRSYAPDLAGAGVALALRAAANLQQRADADRTELVISGPTSASVPVRLTSSVVIEVVRAARDSLLIVSFAAYGVADVVRELADAAARDVRIDLVLEGTAADGGTLRGNASASDAFAALRDRARFWYWPAQHRPVTGNSRAALHAKIIAADTRAALISSANLTDRALSHNLEVGVVLHDPHVVKRLVQHFLALMSPPFEQLQRLQ